MKSNILICMSNERPWYCHIQTAPTLNRVIQRLRDKGAKYPDYYAHIGNGPDGPVVLGLAQIPEVDNE